LPLNGVIKNLEEVGAVLVQLSRQCLQQLANGRLFFPAHGFIGRTLPRVLLLADRQVLKRLK
jgi:hypothetical protein